MFKATVHRVSCRALYGAALGLCLAGPVLASGAGDAAAATSIVEVGEVNFVIGSPVLIHADRSREDIERGTMIRVGDRVETQGSSQVHIRFVDNAMVSVRPRSALEIQRYDYRADSPADSVVKFNLIEGEARAVSGDAAESARQNFRMNTPVAAIGVRGTDFVVRTDAREARALVNQGTIVMAPFSTTCLAEAFGPCADNGLEVAGGGRDVALVVANTAEPILIPANGNGTTENLLVAGRAAVTDAQPAEEPEEESGNDLYTESVSTRVVSRNIAGAPNPVPPTAVDPDFTPDVPIDVASLANTQLAWGRWSEERASRELLSFSRDMAREGRSADTSIGVANDTYILYRVPDGTSELVRPGLGVVAFNLRQAQAYFTDNEGAESLMKVLGGQLSIDFEGNRFSTSLNLRHDATGALTLSDQGQFFRSGNFHSRNPGQVVAGTASFDGTEVGYFFEKTLQNGLIEGITLWGSAP